MRRCFQVSFVFQNAAPESPEMAGLAVEPVELVGATAKFDLSLIVQELSGGLRLSVEFASDLFDGSTAARMLEHYEILLADALERPETSLGRLLVLAPGEREQLLTWKPRPPRDLPRGSPRAVRDVGGPPG